jgi:hypothetical protein
LREVKDQLAVMDLAGTVSGAVAGVASDVELKAVYNFDLRQRRVNWLAMSLEESRAVGHAEPGFQITARLRLATQPAALPEPLESAALAGLDLSAADGHRLLSLRSAGGFQLLHGRQWRVMTDRHDVAILRLVERGDLIAQCNASILPDVPAGRQLEMDSFQADVKRALGDSFGQVIEASQQMTPTGIRMLRVVVSGVVADVPIQWTYYHLSDAQGHQASLVFTLEATLVEQFAEQDQTLVSSFEFQPPLPVAALDTAASPSSSTNKEGSPQRTQGSDAEDAE